MVDLDIFLSERVGGAYKSMNETLGRRNTMNAILRAYLVPKHLPLSVLCQDLRNTTRPLTRAYFACAPGMFDPIMTRTQADTAWGDAS